MKNHQYYVYIMGSPGGVLYVGVTNDLEGRVWQHKNKVVDGFTKKYGCNELLYFEETTDVYAAIAREKQIKNWNRDKKEWLIRSKNPTWKNMSLKWYNQDPSNRPGEKAGLPRDDKEI